MTTYRNKKFYNDIIDIKKRYNETGEINKVDAMNAIIRFIDAYYPDGKKCNMDMILGKLYDAIYSPRNIIIYNHEYGTRFAEDSVSILIENAKTFDVVTRITFQYIESEFSIDCAVIDNRRLTNGKILINNYYFNDSDIVIHSFFRKPNDDEYFKGYIRTIAFDEDGNAYREIFEGPNMLLGFENEKDRNDFLEFADVPVAIMKSLYPENYYDDYSRVYPKTRGRK